MTVQLPKAIRGGGYVCLPVVDHDALVKRLTDSEELLEQADMVVEVLLGDKQNALAQQILDGIERHWLIYEPEEEEQQPDPRSHLVLGQCPACLGINQHEPNCERRKW